MLTSRRAHKSKEWATFYNLYAPNFSKYGPVDETKLLPTRNAACWWLSRGLKLVDRTLYANQSISQKEAKYVSRSRTRVASPVAGRLLRLPHQRVLYPHSPDIGRGFSRLPFHARGCFCSLKGTIGTPEEHRSSGVSVRLLFRRRPTADYAFRASPRQPGWSHWQASSVRFLASWHVWLQYW
jgi:hypothetical protein